MIVSISSDVYLLLIHFYQGVGDTLASEVPQEGVINHLVGFTNRGISFQDDASVLLDVFEGVGFEVEVNLRGGDKRQFIRGGFVSGNYVLGDAAVVLEE